MARRRRKDRRYIRRVERLVLSSQSILAADSLKIRRIFKSLVRDIANILPETIGSDRASIATYLTLASNRIDQTQRQLGRVFADGWTAQQEVLNRIFAVFGDTYLAYGRHMPLVQFDPELFAIASEHSAVLISGVGRDMLRKIDSTLRLGALGLGGGRTRVVGAINAALGGPAAWSSRAEAIFRTETLRMYSLANQAHMEEISRIIPIDKVWRWSHISRVEHARIDGQRVGIREFFRVPLREGGIVLMMHPRDPRASNHPSAVINCGCYSYPIAS